MANKKAKKKKKVEPVKLDAKLKPVAEVATIDEGDDLDRLNNIFGVTDEDDIEGILGGTIGEENW